MIQHGVTPLNQLNLLTEIQSHVKSFQQQEKDLEMCLRSVHSWEDQENIKQQWLDIQEKPKEQFFDKSFEGQDALFMKNYIASDDEMIPIFKDVQNWKRPPEVEKEAMSKFAIPNAADEECKQKDCKGYIGTQSQTQNGFVCKHWKAEFIEQHKQINLNHNHCRNPDGEKSMWCFVDEEDDKSGWDWCEPKDMVNLENCTGNNCHGYRGQQSHTIEGFKCKEWKFGAEKYHPIHVPGGDLVKNYCRNPYPDEDETIWCFTEDEKVGWGWCKPLPKAEQKDVQFPGPSLWGRKGILPAGVHQGKNGSCWFLAVGAALAEWPDRIRKLFANQDYPTNGAFMMNLFFRGEQINILTDDRIPLASHGEPLNSNVSRNGAWWMPILEKAYAKYMVFYANINGGTPMQALRDLTGMPVVRHEAKVENIYDIVKYADDHDYVMSAGCMKEKDGLHPGHAYSLIGAAKFTDDKGKNWKLFKMRNPWAREDYKGPWNDHDERWTPPIRKQLKMLDLNDGVFWMPVELFQETFGFAYVAMYQNWQVSRWYVGSREKGQTFQKFATSKLDQEAWVTLDWMAERHFPPKHCEGILKKHDYNILITDMSHPERKRTQHGTLTNIGYGIVEIEGGMKAGVEYHIIIHDFESTHQSVGHDFTVTVYGEKAMVRLTDSSEHEE